MRQRPPAIVFWNSSSDGRIDSTTRDAWFLQIGRTEVHSFSCSHFYSHVYQYNTRYKFIIKHCVYLNVIMFLNNTLYTFQHYLSRIFDELASFDVSRGYHRHYTPVNIRLSNAVSISRRRGPAIYSASTCTKRSRTVSFKFLSLAIRMIDCFTSIDNRGRLARLSVPLAI